MAEMILKPFYSHSENPPLLPQWRLEPQSDMTLAELVAFIGGLQIVIRGQEWFDRFSPETHRHFVKVEMKEGVA